MEHEAGGTDGGAGPVVSLIEWQAPSMGRADAWRLAEETAAAFRRIPGLLEIRFFGDFESGTHYYFQVWESRSALDAYMASEAMFRIRDAAASYVVGRPARRVLDDYTPPGR
jgi:quinol monooxygenase YgiN